jgi:hypothetical protein
MTAETPPTTDLDRNDIEGALAVHRWYRERGQTIPPDMAHVLLMLQDDDTELVRRLEEQYRASEKS